MVKFNNSSGSLIPKGLIQKKAQQQGNETGLLSKEPIVVGKGHLPLKGSFSKNHLFQDESMSASSINLTGIFNKIKTSQHQSRNLK